MFPVSVALLIKEERTKNVPESMRKFVGTRPVYNRETKKHDTQYIDLLFSSNGDAANNFEKAVKYGKSVMYVTGKLEARAYESSKEKEPQVAYSIWVLNWEFAPKPFEEKEDTDDRGGNNRSSRDDDRGKDRDDDRGGSRSRSRDEDDDRGRDRGNSRGRDDERAGDRERERSRDDDRGRGRDDDRGRDRDRDDDRGRGRSRDDDDDRDRGRGRRGSPPDEDVSNVV